MQSGNTSKAGHGCGGPDKSFLFLLTGTLTLESDCPAIRFSGWESGTLFVPSGALPTTRENPVA